MVAEIAIGYLWWWCWFVVVLLVHLTEENSSQSSLSLSEYGVLCMSGYVIVGEEE